MWPQDHFRNFGYKGVEAAQELISTHVQAIRVMSSSRALSRWFPWTSNTSLIAFCWKPISLNWVRSRRNSAAWNGKILNVKGTVHTLFLWLVVPFIILVWAAQQKMSVNLLLCRNFNSTSDSVMNYSYNAWWFYFFILKRHTLLSQFWNISKASSTCASS